MKNCLTSFSTNLPVLYVSQFVADIHAISSLSPLIHSLTTGPPTFPFNCQVLNQSDHKLFVICIFDTEKSSNSSWNANHLFPAKWQDKTRLLIHPRTHYVCEVYHLTSSHLLANVTTVISEVPAAVVDVSSSIHSSSSAVRGTTEGMTL